MRILLLSVCALALSACAALPEHGREDVAELLQQRGQAAPSSAQRQALLDALGEQPLDPLSAVRIALVNNPALAARYTRIGFAAADVYEAGRLSNPTWSASVLIPQEPGAGRQVSFGLAQSFTDLLFLPARSRLARGEYEVAKLEVADAALDLAAETERAWHQLAAAWQRFTLREAIASAAQASADLAARFHAAGNINRLELAHEQAEAAQAHLDLLEARTQITLARSALNRQMGFDAAEGRWKIDGGVPPPVPEEDALDTLYRLAEAQRLDLAAARRQVALAADELGVTRRFRWLGEVEVGAEFERESDGARKRGPSLALQLPLFNQGGDRVARGEAHLARAEEELRALEIDITHAVRSAAAEVSVARERLEHYRQTLIPLRESIVARMQEQVNYMLAGPFELLRARREEYEAYEGYLDALRDYWLARTDLARAVGAPLPSAAQAGGAPLDAEQLIQPRESGDGHEHHGSLPRNPPQTPDRANGHGSHGDHP
jgi:outer membrane protein, heavy metal efflux system